MIGYKVRIRHVCLGLLGSCVCMMHALAQTATSSLPPPDVETLLKGLEENYECLPKAATTIDVDARFDGEYNWDVMQRNGQAHITLWRDGDKVDQRTEASLTFAAGQGEQRRRRASQMVITDQVYSYDTPYDKPAEVLYVSRSNEEYWDGATVYGGDVGILYGRIPGNGRVPLVELAKKEGTVRAKEEVESIDGARTYLLEAETPHGQYRMWVDPAAGYSLRRLEVHRTGDSLWEGLPLSKATVRGAKEAGSEPNSPVVSEDTVLDSTKVDYIDGKFVVTAASVTTTRVYQNGQSTSSHVKISRKCDLNPNFEALGAFAVNVPDNTPAVFTDERQSGVQYTWRGGKLDLVVNDEAIKAIRSLSSSRPSDKTAVPVEHLQGSNAPATAPSRRAAPPRPGAEGVQVSVWLWLAAALIVVGVAIAGGVVRWSRRGR